MAEARKRHRVFEIDDGGSFDRLVEETRRIVEMRGGTEAEATHLLQCRVLEAFVRKNRKGVRAEERKDKSKKADCLGAETEKKNERLMFVLRSKRNSKWILEGNSGNEKTNCLGSEKTKSKTGLTISLKRKRVLGETEGICENKKLKISKPKVPKELEKRIKGKGGRDIQLVIRKKLTKTDLSTHQGRLLIPLKQMRKDACFLTKQEEAILSSEEKGSNGIRVMVMEPCGVDSEMVLVKWNMQTSKNYGLRTGWNKAIERNHEEAKHLAVDQFIQLWSFRVASQHWFAIDTNIPSSSSSSSSSSDSHSNVELQDQSTVED